MNQTAHQESLILLLKTAVLPHQHALQAWDSWKEKFGAQCKSAVETRFAPVIARRFAEWGFRDGWHSLLQDAARQAQLRNQLMFSTAVPIISRLQHLAISCLLLKGWGLIAAGIAETGYRYLGDIDILIPIDKIDEACACLRDEHWTLEKVPQENQLAYHAYHYRGPAGSVIDLHWHATFFWRRTDFDQALWTNSVTVQIGNLTLNVLSPEDMFFHACIHGNYALGYEWHWMLDAALILGKCGGHLHWDRICELAEQSRTILVLQKAFAYLETHLDIEIPQESKALLARSRLAITERFDAYAQRSAWVPGRRLAALLSSYWRTSGPDSGSAPVMPFIDYLRFRWGLSESSSLMASILRRIVKPVPVANE